MIELRDVCKQFGATQVLININASFEDEKIHGLIGRNGSGKTVLLKCICGLIRPTSGSIVISGKQLGKDIEMPESFGALIDNPGFLPNYSGEANLSFLMSVNTPVMREKVQKALRQVGLEGDRKKHVGKYSLGMRQKLGIAQVIMEDPMLMIFDEPMNGLDNKSVSETRELFKQLRDRKRTILLASHNAQDIDELCDSVYEIDAGRMTQIR
ncbi:MAG: ATP-binding cassette domain-containing protein [Eubacteriales bacterium]|mgnify:FL=1|nr:ATP-binding cassette domain-containing protein [Eubacteriales bacterium]